MFNRDSELLRGLAQAKSVPKSPCDKQIDLVATMGQSRPKDATPVQFYNYVREVCIIHNCSIDEAMELAPEKWTKLSQDQRKLYESAKHAALPIPVPRHLVYRAIQMERAGRCKLSSAPTANGLSTKYSMQSYIPPTKPIKQQTRLWFQPPRYDNLAETPPSGLDLPRNRTHRSNIPEPNLPTSQANEAPQQQEQKMPKLKDKKVNMPWVKAKPMPPAKVFLKRKKWL